MCVCQKDRDTEDEMCTCEREKERASHPIKDIILQKK